MDRSAGELEDEVGKEVIFTAWSHRIACNKNMRKTEGEEGEWEIKEKMKKEKSFFICYNLLKAQINCK